MSPVWFLYIGLFLVFFVLLPLAIWLGIRHAKHEEARRETLRGYARDNGLYYSQSDTTRPDEYRAFTPFGRGHSRRANDCISGRRENGLWLDVFEYHYAETHHNGKHSHTQHYWNFVCAIQMPIMAPTLTIQPEHIGHKLFDALGGEDIDFESDEFSRRFWVRCKDRRFAYDVIHPRMMEHLLGRPTGHWQWNGDTLLIHEKGRKLAPATVERLLAEAEGFRQLVPGHLVRDEDHKAANARR